MPEDRSRVSRSFAWLNVTQFLGAMNDNIFKLLVIFVLLRLLGDGERTTIVAATSLIFVLPFLLFSHAAGVLADRYSKRTVIVGAKFGEAAVMIIGCVGIALQSPTLLYVSIFLMCTQSAVFGPSKYGIIPELVDRDQLSRANGLLTGLTYLAIILGTTIPSFLLLEVLDGNCLQLGVFCVLVAACGTLTSLRIVKTPVTGRETHFSIKFIQEIFRTVAGTRRDRPLFLALMGSAYFLFLAAFIQQNIFLYGGERLGLDWQECGYLFPVAALGIGLGAVCAGMLSGRNIEFGIVPIGAAGLTALCIVLGLMAPSLKGVSFMIFLIGLSSGLFIVPLNAFIQYRSPAARRGEILACSSFLSFLGVGISAGLLVFLDKVVGLGPSARFVIIGILTGGLAVTTIAVLPDFFVRFIGLVLTRLVYRIRVGGRENIPVDGPALLVANHVTWVDALLIAATTQRRIRFLMAREIYEKRIGRWLFDLMGTIPISPADRPREVLASLQRARESLDEGYLVCIFAEGAITRNGNMRAFRSGLERIVRGTDYPVIPVYIGGAWGSIFSYYRGRILSTFPQKIPYPISIRFGSAMPSSSTPFMIRQAVTELSAETCEDRKCPGRTLPVCLIASARRNWFKSAMSDSSGRRVRYGEALVSAFALGSELVPLCGESRMVGVLLPSTVGGAVANFALSLAGKVPVNLNFTASKAAMASSIERAEITTVVTSRVFLKKLRDVSLPPVNVVYLEEIARSIGGMQKGVALAKALLMPKWLFRRRLGQGPDDVATVIFSSGSTGEPKGVALTHHNILSNLESFRTALRFQPDDGICGMLPFFHSFGFTCTLWFPFLNGFRVAYHPNPLDASKIGAMVEQETLSVLLSTPTFLLSYMRKVKPEQFASLRAVVTGAEKLNPELSEAFESKFGVRPREGYGATELSPAASFNVADVTEGRVTQVGTKFGSIGQPLPGIAARIVDADTGEELGPEAEGELLIKGPNVMKGYLGQPEKTAEVLKDGWYRTGDICRSDADGFLFIVDRKSRYSKIGGEMVPHANVEDLLMAGIDSMDRAVAVTGAPDARKGEQLVVFYTPEAGEVDDMMRILKKSDLPNLWRPRKENFVPIDEMPQLGSGKLDLKNLRVRACEYVENRPGPIGRAVDKLRENL